MYKPGQEPGLLDEKIDPDRQLEILMPLTTKTPTIVLDGRPNNLRKSTNAMLDWLFTRSIDGSSLVNERAKEGQARPIGSGFDNESNRRLNTNDCW